MLCIHICRANGMASKPPFREESDCQACIIDKQTRNYYNNDDSSLAAHQNNPKLSDGDLSKCIYAVIESSCGSTTFQN